MEDAKLTRCWPTGRLRRAASCPVSRPSPARWGEQVRCQSHVRKAWTPRRRQADAPATTPAAASPPPLQCLHHRRPHPPAPASRSSAAAGWPSAVGQPHTPWRHRRELQPAAWRRRAPASGAGMPSRVPAATRLPPWPLHVPASSAQRAGGGSPASLAPAYLARGVCGSAPQAASEARGDDVAAEATARSPAAQTFQDGRRDSDPGLRTAVGDARQPTQRVRVRGRCVILLSDNSPWAPARWRLAGSGAAHASSSRRSASFGAAGAARGVPAVRYEGGPGRLARKTTN